jgi:beta-galactosidase
VPFAFLAWSSAPRQVVDLDAGWQFARVPSISAPNVAPGKLGTDWQSQYNIARVQIGDAKYDPSPAQRERLKSVELAGALAWQPATLPHAAWIRPLDDPATWQGVTYYRRRIEPWPGGRRAVLVLQGMQSVDVWLNGRHVAERRGGYLPLRAELSSGGDLLVRVDNSDNPLIPPGKPQSQVDFMYGCGLIGHASLEFGDPVHLVRAGDMCPAYGGAGTWLEEPTLAAGRANETIHLTVHNETSHARAFRVRASILDAQGHIICVARARSVVVEGGWTPMTLHAEISRPRLWSPDAPNHYRLRVELVANGRTVDQETIRFGVRTISVSRDRGFVLNGKPIELRGTNRHQDYPWIGPALSDAANYRDALLIKRAGHNIVRLSHYNQSPAFLDACDEIGLMVIPCIPGWQFVNRDERFTDRVERVIRETIDRDRNHPAVAWWETSLNETYPPANIAQQWHETAVLEGVMRTAGDEGKGAPWEITYNGWREDLSRPSNSLRPGYIREYGDYEFGGATSSSRVRLRDGLDKLLGETWNHVWSLNKFRPQRPWTMGQGTWEMFDHNVPWEFAVSASGLADLMRREKPSFWFFASQASPRPYLRVAADWQPGSPTRRVVVFTNAARVTLKVNGRVVRTASPSWTASSKYDFAHQWDGANTGNLAHPPIVFADVPFSAGELTAVGDNRATDCARTAGAPTGLHVWVDDLGVPAETNDCVVVRAAVVDSRGTVCPKTSPTVRFSGAPFAGQSEVRAEAGIASVLVRTSMAPGAYRLSAVSGGLRGTCVLVYGTSKSSSH